MRRSDFRQLTIGYMSGLPPAQQERIFDAWMRIRRDPSAARTLSAEIAGAMLERLVRRVTQQMESAEESKQKEGSRADVRAPRRRLRPAS